MGIVRNRYGVYEARKKVPKRLEEATATVLGASKQRQIVAQEVIRDEGPSRSESQSKARAHGVRPACSRAPRRSSAEKPLRASLTQAEIDRMAELHYAKVLAEDDEEAA